LSSVPFATPMSRGNAPWREASAGADRGEIDGGHFHLVDAISGFLTFRKRLRFA